MKEFIVGINDAGQRADKFITKAVPALPASLLYKYLRLKRIKCNGKRLTPAQILSEGDVLCFYINDEFFEKTDECDAYLHIRPQLNIVYEDQNILLVDKKPGMPVHSDEREKTNTLISHIKAYLYNKGEYKPEEENSFAPALCNRIDRNTGGIVIAAKNASTLRVMNQKIKDREIQKSYLCLVHGRMSPPSGELRDNLIKLENEKRVIVSAYRAPSSRLAVTKYRTVSSKNGISLVECELVTGRTHQIRAQFAAAGHPLVGDGKYGSNAINKPYGRKYQALYSYKISFDFKTPANHLEYLKGKGFCIKDIDFVSQYDLL